MNKIHTVIWSFSKVCWVVVSELVSNAGKAKSHGATTRKDVDLDCTLAILPLHLASLKFLNTRVLLGSVVVPLVLSLGWSPVTFAAAGDGIYINDGTDIGCSYAGDVGVYAGRNIRGACTSSDKADQTNRALFYNPSGSEGPERGLGSTSLTLGNELFVNGGSTEELADTVPAAAHINTLDMRDTKILQLGSGAVSANSSDAVNGSQLFATNTNVDTLGNQLSNLVTSSEAQFNQLSEGISSALGGGTQIDPVTGAVTAPSFSTTAIDATGTASTTPTASANVGDALSSLNNSLVNTAAVGVKYDDVNTKTRVTFNQGGASTTLTNVAAGSLSATSTDAVNGSQLFATNTNVDTLGNQLSNLVTSSGAQLNQLSEGISSVLGGGAQIDPVTGAVTAPSFSTTAIDAAGTASTTPTTSANVGDALSSLNNSLVNTAAVGVKYDDVNTKTRVTFNQGGASTTLTNVAAGSLSATSTDAVNGSQLFATNTNVDTLGNQLSNLVTSSGAQLNQLSEGISSALGGGTQIDPVTGAVTAPSFSTTAIDAAGTASATPTTSANVGDALSSLNNSLVNTAAVGVKYDDVNTKTRVTFNQGGASTTLTNVAAGSLSATSTDAVNGSQLNATNTSVTHLGTTLGESITNLGNDFSTQLGNLVTSSGAQLNQLGEGISSALGGGAQIDPVTGAVTAPSFSTTAIDATGTASTTPTTSANVGDALSSLNNSLVNTAAVGVKYDDVNTKTRVTFNQGGASTTLTNVAAGSLSATSTDAVNGSQLNATNTSVTHLGTTLGESITNLGNDFSTQLGNLVTSSGAQLNQLSEGISSALGGGTQIDPVTGAVTAPSFSTTAIDAAGTASTTPTTSANVGDALSSLNNSLVNTAAVGVKYDDVNTKTRVTFNQGGASTTLTNVAAGSLSATSTDAVNGSQLFATNNNVTVLGNRVSGLNTQIDNIVNSGTGIKYFHTQSARADSVASGADSIAVGPNAQASASAAVALGNDATAMAASSVAIGDGATAKAIGSVALGQGASDDQRGTKNYVGKYSGADNSTTGVVSIGNASTGQTRALSNVADAEELTDAVNLRQLDGAVTESKAYTDISVKQVQSSIKDMGTTMASNSKNFAKVEADISSIQKGTSGAFQVNNSRNAQQPKVTGANAVAGGMGSQALGDNSVALGSNSVASAKNSTATGNDAQATADNSVALGANSVADRENSISVGHSGSERQITNVAAGSRMTDAVNVEQLSRSVANITNEANSYTDQRFADIRRNLKQQDNTLSAGIAGAMAMASLPRSSLAGASMTSIAMGNYRGQSALAIGVSHVSDNGRWSTNLMGTTSTQSDTGVAIGVGYQW